MENKNLKELREKNGLTVEQASVLLGVTLKTIYRWEKGEIKPRSVIDLFAGIGGIRRGFDEINGKCIFTSEWDQYAQRTYRANFLDDHTITGDITKIKITDVPPHDVLLAGFPCQPFSIAGVSKKKITWA